MPSAARLEKQRQVVVAAATNGAGRGDGTWILAGSQHGADGPGQCAGRTD